MKNISFALGLVMLFACASEKKEQKSAAAESAADKATAAVASPDQNVQGQVNIEKTDKGILVNANFTGLQPKSVHGFHVHKNGKCEGPDFKTAGDHFNPEGTPHGGPSAPKSHAGDLGN